MTAPAEPVEPVDTAYSSFSGHFLDHKYCLGEEGLCLTGRIRRQINKHGMDSTTGQVSEWHRRDYRKTRTYIGPMP
ncbi:hypothetical protein [Streptomyces sp. SCSIO ZS0520]|uniref:hypothetical protein n=1 Tax=Streptomyces sp. SCSIO ZS0520 TaxID=2892996 RepID=UPI0021DA130A|nr:hypothetical protein [Streptomyces sp. SCSIO ZS0520]